MTNVKKVARGLEIFDALKAIMYHSEPMEEPQRQAWFADAMAELRHRFADAKPTLEYISKEWASCPGTFR